MYCANCRAPLTPGSRFCNACGAAVTAGPAPGGERTGAYQRPPQAGPPQPGMAPTFQVPSNTPYYGAPPPEPMPAKKPVALLAAILLLVAGSVVAGSVFLFQKSRTAVTAGQVAAVPQAPGLQQAPTQAMPQGPGVITAPNRPQVPGQPVTSAPQLPKGDGMAPNVMMAPGSQAPTAPSVTQAPSVQTPSAPPVLSAPNQAPAPAAPVTQAPRAQPKPQAPPQPQVVDNSDFDRYIRWLQFVEQERSGLRAQGETESFRMIESFYQAAMGLADPDTNDAVMQQQFDRNIQVTLNRTVAAIRLFRQNILRTKPAVPSDCKALDQYYMAAMEQEGLLTANLIDALARKDIGRIKMLARGGTGNIDRNLGQANLRLEQAFRGRGLNQQFRIETGGNSSMLGGLMGMGGL